MEPINEMREKRLSHKSKIVAAIEVLKLGDYLDLTLP